MIPTHQATIQKGKIMLKDINRFHLWIGQFEGKEVQVIVRKKTTDRSSSQNKLYWKFLEIIELDTGNDKDDLHEFFKRKFLPPRFITTKWER